MAKNFTGISTADLEARLAELKSRQPAQVLSMDNLASVYAQAQEAGDPFAGLFDPAGLSNLSEQDMKIAQQRYADKYGPGSQKIPDTIFNPQGNGYFKGQGNYSPMSRVGTNNYFKGQQVPAQVTPQQQQPTGTNSVLADAYTNAMLKQGMAGVTQPDTAANSIYNYKPPVNAAGNTVAAPPVPAQPGFLQRLYSQQQAIQQPVRGDANFIRER